MTINESSPSIATPEVVELPARSPAETRRLIEEWNDTAVAYAQTRCLHRLFEEQVARTPAAIALTFEDRQLTYRELNERANQLARHLSRAGVGRDSIVPICVERSIEMVVGLYGILKAGAAYLPLDPAYPTDRLAFMLEDCRSSVLLTERRLLEVMPPHEARAICLDTDWQEIERETGDNLSVEVAADNLAYVIYTSGSTGKPKGAMNTHRGVCNRLLWMQDAYRLDATDCVLQKTPFSFDVSVWEFFWPLLNGARLVVARPLGHHDNAYLADVIAAERVTTIHFVPPMLQVFLEEPELASKCSSLRRVICSGEALPYDLQRRFFSYLDAELHNLYGPTEAAVDVTFWQCERDGDLRIVPIGRPIANTRIYLLDEQLEPVPVGIAGELHIGGVCLARGYLNRTELTAERFIPDPLSREPGERLYKTGDLARYLPDGAVEYVGRIDHQVKLSGVRIELGEIEAAVIEHPSIREAVVLAREDAPGNKRLVAYVVSAGAAGATPPDADLRAFLSERLPHYMVPSAYVRMEKWPLTSSGKVDRLRLPAPAARDGRTLVAPRTAVEELIAGYWRELMQLPEVSVDDNFFNLGGHSLLAASLIARLRRELRADVQVHDVLASPTVALLAAKIEARRRSGQQATAEPVERDIDRDVADGSGKLSYAQQRLWFLHLLKPDSAFYNLPLAARLRGSLNVAALAQSLGEIARRHEALRTRFVEIDGEPRQLVGEPSPVPVALIDVSDAAGEAEREGRAQQALHEVVRTPFDLAHSPPWRSVVVRLGAEEHILCVVMHHIISDGWSMQVFERELSALYADYAAGRAPTLAEPPVRYADYTAWQRRRLSRGAEDEHLRYWREQLGGARTILRLYTDRPRPAVESYEGRTLYTTLDAPLTQSLRALSRRESSTLYMTLMAAFNVLLHRYTGETDISVGTPLAGRDRVETESLIGFFVNTVVIRTRLSGQMSFRELLGHVRETTLAAYAHQELRFERIVEELAVERSLSHAPLFQVVFAFNQSARRAPELPGLEAELLEIDTATAKYDLAMFVEDAGAELKLAVEYSTQLFNPETIEQLTAHLKTLLAGIVADPGSRLSALPLLTDAESEHLVSQWNDTQEEFFLSRACIHELIERQVELRPDADAVISARERLTYSELNARANRLARQLRALGVELETPVAICAGRSSPRMVVGALGVLKAGGAYVPLDPAYPQERLRFMLEETGAPVLLTERSLLDRLPPCSAHVLYLDDAEETDAGDEHNPGYPVRPDNLAYVIYTSGSTGRPKGVAVQHGGLVNLAHWNRESYGLDAQTRASQVAGYSFDASVWEMWAFLAAGGSLSIVDNATVRSPTLLWRWIKREGITHCFMPTPLVDALLQLYRLGTLTDYATPGALRYLFTGGDKLHGFLPDGMPFHLINIYGPAENTVWSTVEDVGRAARPGISPSIGRPISNTRAYILDEHLRPVPVGVPGEVYVAGCALARGYLNRPELTAERFIPDPFSSREGLKVQAHMSDAMKDMTGLSPAERVALVMQLRKTADTAGSRELIARRGETGATPLSFAQQRLWFLNVMEPNSPYTIWTNFHLKGQLDAAALERALNEIVSRHESLRTTFPDIEGQPVQFVTPQLTLAVPVHDLSGLDEDARSAELERHKHELRRPFDLAREPLFRARLLRLAADEHALLLSMHHIITDGWSIGVMLRELTALYEAFIAGRAPVLPPLSIQYRDFAVWQREWLSGAELERQLAYWRENLRGAPPALVLPTDRPRPPVQSYRGASLERELGKPLTAALNELSRARGVTLYMTLLAAFKTLLYRYTGQEEIVVGTPIANRNRMEIENLIGFFVNTLVLRTSLSANPTFSELLARVRDVTLGAYAHQDLPFEKLVEELHPERDMSRTPLFQVMFSLQNEPFPPLRLGGVVMQLMDDETKSAQFDLTLDLIERETGILCTLEFNTDLFDRETAERMFDHYVRLLEEVVADPNRRLLELPLLTDKERQRLLVEWNDTAREYPRDRCVHELFEEGVAQRAESIALVAGEERLTYAELNARANRLAHYLRRAGLRPEARAGLLLERTAEAGVALLAVLKAGGAYVAFDASYPPERVRRMLEDAGASILLTTRRLADGLTGQGVRVVCLDAEQADIAAESAENPAPVAAADNLAYLVYTSGTTGRPKGILIPHRSLTNAIYAFITHHRVTERDRILQFASLSFDVATEEFFAAWLGGARLVMRPEPAAAIAPEQFVRFLEDEGVTLVNLPASFWAEWVAAIAERGCKLPTGLRRVVVGNEKTLPESLAKWQRAVGRLVTWNNAYGPSETTITASNYEPQGGEGREGASAVPIGRPVMNATMYVLDQAQGLAPIGVAGELCIGGAGVARGYHGQPGQTAERFTPNCYDAAGGERMYRTGDLARYMPDGNIEFLGRVDDQVKVRGFRIELGEIEIVLNRHEGVREAVVIARPDERGGNRLVAYVVVNEGRTATAGELQRHLKDSLPEYMIPSAFVTLDALPLTPNGKIDRRQLPETDGARPELDEVYVAPRSELERGIANVWQEVLKVEKVGVHDNFFNLGGHSLLIVQVTSRVQETLRLDVSLIDMFKYPTVSALAEHLSRESSAPSAPAAARGAAGTRLEATERQRQMRQRQQQQTARRRKGGADE